MPTWYLLCLTGLVLGVSDRPVFAFDPAQEVSSYAPLPMPALTAPAPNDDASAAGHEPMPVDLLTALRLANTANPTIALARERVAEAYGRLREAELAWIPDLRGGPAYLRHDGRIQNSLGLVFPTSKQNLFLGGGAVVSWDTTNVYFGPLIARRLVQAQAAASRGVTDNVQLDVALAYLDLLQIHGQLAINADTTARADEMLHDAEAADRAGLSKTPADINRARTEIELRREERIDLTGQAAVVSARLARLLLLEPTVDLRPADPTVLPITLVPPELALEQMIAIGMQNRPEAAEGRALVRAAQARWRQTRVSPFFPRLDVSYAGGDFGGGLHGELGNWGARSDGQVAATWELHNFGAGDVARARVQRSVFNQANLHVVEVQAQVGEDVTAAAKLARARLDALDSAQKSVREALETWRRLRAAAFGLAGPQRTYDPLEPLLAEQALDQARTRYLNQVIEYNKAQFRLYWAMGQPPLCALPGATQPLDVPAVPPAPPRSEPLGVFPAPRPTPR
jgi:outer membrane protein TolC